MYRVSRRPGTPGLAAPPAGWYAGPMSPLPRSSLLARRSAPGALAALALLSIPLSGGSGGARAGSPAPAARPSPYPEAWIEEGRKANAPRTREPGCLHLVYKRGCAEKRTGRVVVGITLDRTTGKVSATRIVSSSIRTDPKPMHRCITEGLGRWTFRPPGDHAATFELTLIYSDRC